MLEKIKAFIGEAQKYAKAIVAGTGTLLTALTALSTDLGVTIIPADVVPYVTFGLFVLTSFATWRVPNAGFVADPYSEGLGDLPSGTAE